MFPLGSHLKDPDQLPLRLGRKLAPGEPSTPPADPLAWPFDTPSAWALQRAAQAWCTPHTSSIEMDHILATAFARILDAVRGELEDQIEAAQSAEAKARRASEPYFGETPLDRLRRKRWPSEEYGSITPMRSPPIAISEQLKERAERMLMAELPGGLADRGLLNTPLPSARATPDDSPWSHLQLLTDEEG
jgi:hypothetical protein